MRSPVAFTDVRSQPVDKLSKERPLGNIFSFYVLFSVLLQFSIHIVSFLYVTGLSEYYEPFVFFR